MTSQPLLQAGNPPDGTALTPGQQQRVAWFRAAQAADATKLAALIEQGVDVNMKGPGGHPAISHVLHAFIDGDQNLAAIAAVVKAPGFDATKVPNGLCRDIASALHRYAAGRVLLGKLEAINDPELRQMLYRSNQLNTQRLGEHDPLDPNSVLFTDAEVDVVAVGRGRQLDLSVPWPGEQDAWFTAALDGDTVQLGAQTVDVNARDHLGRSALWLAVHANQVGAVKSLFAHPELCISADSSGPLHLELSSLHRYLHQSAGSHAPGAEQQMAERQALVGNVLPALLAPPHSKVAHTLWGERNVWAASRGSCLRTVWNCAPW